MQHARMPRSGADSKARANVARLSVPDEFTNGTTGRVKKHFHVRGESAEQLERRIAALRCALSLCRGLIVRIKWRPSSSGRQHRATVHYELPRLHEDRQQRFSTAKELALALHPFAA